MIFVNLDIRFNKNHFKNNKIEGQTITKKNIVPFSMIHKKNDSAYFYALSFQLTN